MAFSCGGSHLKAAQMSKWLCLGLGWALIGTDRELLLSLSPMLLLSGEKN